MKADVYAFGMLLFRLACPELSLPLESGRQVTFNSEIAEMRREISAGLAFERPENVDKDYWDLVCACLKENPAERPQFSQICTVIQHLPKFKTPSRDKCRYLERITELSSHFDSSFNAPSVSHEEVLLFENPVYKDAIAGRSILEAVRDRFAHLRNRHQLLVLSDRVSQKTETTVRMLEKSRTRSCLCPERRQLTAVQVNSDINVSQLNQLTIMQKRDTQ